MKPEEKIFLAFFETKETKLYFNQLQKLTKLGPSSLNNTIKKLKEKNILKEIKTQANTFYTIKNQELKHIEFAKIALSKFNSLNYQITTPLKDLLKEINNIKTIILFGSSSRGEEKKDSDIDLLFVINKFENEKLNELYKKEITQKIEKAKKKGNRISIYPISIFITDEHNFINDKDDYLVISAKQTGFPIYNREEYYQLIENEN